MDKLPLVKQYHIVHLNLTYGFSVQHWHLVYCGGKTQWSLSVKSFFCDLYNFSAGSGESILCVNMTSVICSWHDIMTSW